jgi:hypothetical protein
MGLMDSSDWVLIGTSIFLGVVALFVPYLAELIKRKLFSPKLKIIFEEHPPGCHKTKITSRNKKGEIIREEPCFYFRFQVENEGKSQAKQCEAVVENLSIADAAGNFGLEKSYTPVNLLWGGSYGEFVEINPGRRFFCDLIHVPSKEHQEIVKQYGHYVDPPETDQFEVGMVLNVKMAFYSQPNRLPAGKYRVDVAIYSENAEKVKQALIVTWSGIWKDSEAGMFKELVIEIDPHSNLPNPA